jgi:hypothetical protein
MPQHHPLAGSAVLAPADVDDAETFALPAEVEMRADVVRAA